MKRLQGRLRSYRITPIGWFSLIAIPVALVVAGLGPTSAQAPAFIIAVLAALLTVAGIASGSRGRWGKSLAERRAEFGPIDRAAPDALTTQDPDADAWRRERERRAEHDR